ncbi:MAG: DNA translocase FtsK [Verrucomicrobia bacterium]|nr:DNA translocase FtsK [Verrucomicrobiota bacterium]
MAHNLPHNPWNDVPALLMLGCGTLLFLALVSYQPSDLPGWVPFSLTATNPQATVQNFIGPVGAVVTGLLFFLFGAASFLLTAILLGFGVGKLFIGGLRAAPRVPWMIGFVVTGACLLHLQHWFLGDWREKFNVPGGAGGWLGSWLGERILSKYLLGSVGSLIVLGTAYVCCAILMTGLHPIAQLRRGCDALYHGLSELRRRQREARLARTTERERLEQDSQRLAKEQKRLEKQLRRQGITPPADDAAETGRDTTTAAAAALDDEFAHLPPPKITDNSAPPPPAVTPAKKKPSLAEIQAAKALAQAAALAAETDGGADIRFANYELPDVELLDTREVQDHQAVNEKEFDLVQNKIVETLEQFGIKVAKGDITRGPTITRYEVYPAKGVRVDKIVSLERDIARATRAERINILAPIPGKDTVGIEIANSKKVKVTLRELVAGADWETAKANAKIPLALGKDVYGKTIIADLAAMPHCLIAGATGSGKSVCINSIVASLLYKFKPAELKLVMIDPKVVELQVYNGLPHLAVPVVTDPKKVLITLRWVIDEMMKRYELFAKAGVRNITSFNARPKPKSQAELDAEAAAAAAASGGSSKSQVLSSKVDGEDSTSSEEGSDTKLEAHLGGITPVRNEREAERVPERLPFIVVIVDELADLMQTAPADVESAIARITQMARAAGIHMIIATQTPRADVITGVIKANVPSRIAFQVASALDSRVILDENGAERLLGQGDMLYRPPGTSRLVRAQGVFVTDEEVHRLVDFARQQGAPTFESTLHEQLNAPPSLDDDVSEEDEELVQKCIEIMRQEKKCSTSMLQRRLRLGYTRAARVVDVLEARGVVGPENGARGREIRDLDILHG